MSRDNSHRHLWPPLSKECGDYSRYGYFYPIKERSESYQIRPWKGITTVGIPQMAKVPNGTRHSSPVFNAGRASAERRSSTPQKNSELMNVGIENHHSYSQQNSSKSVPKTPFEMWTGRVPSLKHLRVWGSPAEAKVINPTIGKLIFQNSNLPFHWLSRKVKRLSLQKSKV